MLEARLNDETLLKIAHCYKFVLASRPLSRETGVGILCAVGHFMLTFYRLVTITNWYGAQCRPTHTGHAVYVDFLPKKVFLVKYSMQDNDLTGKRRSDDILDIFAFLANCICWWSVSLVPLVVCVIGAVGRLCHWCHWCRLCHWCRCKVFERLSG